MHTRNMYRGLFGMVKDSDVSCTLRLEKSNPNYTGGKPAVTNFLCS